MSDLVAALRGAGFSVIDERVAGRPGRTLDPVGVMIHHTASSRRGGDTPALRTVLYGRPDVRGPLCNLLIGRSGTIVGISDGSANHSGGGHSSAWDRFFGGEAPVDLPPGLRDDHHHISNHTVGIEVENDGIGEPWSEHLYGVVVDVTAALCASFDIDPASRVLGHKEWSARKIDPTFDMAKFRADVARRLAAPTHEDDDMTPEQAAQLAQVREDVKNIRAALRKISPQIDGLVRTSTETAQALEGALADQGVHATSEQIRAALDGLVLRVGE